MVTTEILGEQPVSRELNPFIALLWVVGPGMVVFGVIPQFQYYEAQRSGGVGRGTAVLQEVIWSLSLSGVIVGLGVIAGLLFWHANRWQTRRAQTPVD